MKPDGLGGLGDPWLVGPRGWARTLAFADKRQWRELLPSHPQEKISLLSMPFFSLSSHSMIPSTSCIPLVVEVHPVDVVLAIDQHVRFHPLASLFHLPGHED